MKLTNKEHDAIKNDSHIYIIKYVASHGCGEMIIKKSFWEKVQKKFTKVMKDVTITSIEEVKE